MSSPSMRRPDARSAGREPGSTARRRGAVPGIPSDAGTPDERCRCAELDAVRALSAEVLDRLEAVVDAVDAHARSLVADLPEGDFRRIDAAAIRAAAERGAALAEDLAAAAHRPALEPALTDVNELLRALQPQLQQALGRRVDVVTALDGGAGRLWVDPARFRDVLWTLAVRAAAATPDGGRLMIRTARQRLDPKQAREYARPIAGGRYMVVRIGDTVAPAAGGAVARMDGRTAPGAAAEPVDGGLELWSAYGIVHRSGGYLRVRADDGGRPTYELFVPEFEKADAIEDRPAPASETSTPRGTVMVVEDDASVRSLVRRTLTRRGYAVLEAADGKEALALAHRVGDDIDYLVTDVVMPRMGGIELAKELLPIQPELRVLFISGHVDDPTRFDREFGDGTGFLRKPFSPDEITRELRGPEQSAGGAARTG